MANLAGSYDPDAAPRGDFDPIPDGEYVAEIIESDIVDVSPNGDKGRELKLTWKVAGGDYDGRLVWQRLKMWADNMNNLDKVISIAQSEFAAVRHATGKIHVQDSAELHYIPCAIRVAIKVDQSGRYAPSNVIKNVKPIGSAPAQSAAPAFKAPPASTAKPAASGGSSAPWRQKQPA